MLFSAMCTSLVIQIISSNGNQQIKISRTEDRNNDMVNDNRNKILLEYSSRHFNRLQGYFEKTGKW